MFVYGGLVLDADQSHHFEDEWLAAINPLPFLHTSQFLAGPAEGYQQWNGQGLRWKQELLRKAATVIAKRAFSTFSTALAMDDSTKISHEQHFDEAIGHSYSFCARFSTVQVTHWSKANLISGSYRYPSNVKRNQDEPRCARYSGSKESARTSSDKRQSSRSSVQFFRRVLVT